jgi:2-polyprenyl-3-methyl-5-hydroxy-6-metoxy-1,4-benzoquinol methylase
MKVLSTQFWNEHWRETCLPQTVNYDIKLDRLLANVFKKYLPNGQNGTRETIEIGCAPGKWLVFFAREMNYKVSGFDFSTDGVNQTLENFRLTEVDGAITREDIYKFKSTKKYDLVYSLGFIEHFDNVDEIIIKHCDILEKGGYLVLGLPNFKGINYFIQKLIDKSILGDHNLSIMNRAFLKNIANKLNLEPVFLEYIGGFAPSMFVHKTKDNIRRLYNNSNMFKWIVNLLLKLNVFSYINSRFFSSYIIAIYRK